MITRFNLGFFFMCKHIDQHTYIELIKYGKQKLKCATVTPDARMNLAAL